MTADHDAAARRSPTDTNATDRGATPAAGRSLPLARRPDGAPGLLVRSLTRPRPSVALEISHRRRVRAAEDALTAARAAGDPETVRAAMRDLDEARDRARLWAR